MALNPIEAFARDVDPHGPPAVELPAPPESGYRALWWAVLRDVFECKTYAGEAKKQRRIDARWITSACDAMGSFLWLCEALGLSPKAVRRAYFQPALPSPTGTHAQERHV